MPPRVPKRTKRSCISVSLPTNLGRSRLSRLPATAPQMTARRITPEKSPPMARIARAGSQMIAVPTAGIMESTAMTVPQKTAPCIPARKKAKPHNPPCNIPMMKVDFMVAPATEVKRKRRRSSSSWTMGR
ncbi:hypothetical protein H206_05176 [Candidatus Electrothrix aarhusensis]|uniref:Uncharacterized protein n=1 Tax=Candidatus Electrothrix aarhusensis TaxID=1859131 RepID=A0A3S3QIF7_9BACT|nr:hypothetical protein H206_05176 [Candidatus Electrothrix aarhusensis]